MYNFLLMTPLFVIIFINTSYAQNVSKLMQERINQDLSQIKQDNDVISGAQQDISAMQTDITNINSELAEAQVIDAQTMPNK